MHVQMIRGAACGEHSTWGSWKKEETSLHINMLEMTAAFFAVKIYAASSSETLIDLRVASINKQNAPNGTVHLLLKEFWNFCAEKEIWVPVSYISSHRNKVAGKESRKLRNNLEW